MGDKYTGKVSLGPEYDHQKSGEKGKFSLSVATERRAEIEIAFLLQVTKVLHYSHEAMLKQR